jgi:hypothetical protein
MSRYRPEEYDLRSLERGLKLKTSEIVLGMSLLGWNITASTLSRLRTGSDVNIDVAGLPFYTIRRLFPTRSGVAIVAQMATLINRRALEDELTGDQLERALNAAEELIEQAEDQYGQLRKPDDEEDQADRTLDSALIAEAKAQLAATRNQHLAALGYFLGAYRKLLPVARMPGCQLGVIVCLGRSLAAALNEAFDCDEAAGRPIGKEPVGRDWHLWNIVQQYKDLSLRRLLVKAIDATGDDRMAANHVDGFALAAEPREAARMLQMGLALAREKVTLKDWQPPGRDKPVIGEDYLKSAVAEYERHRVEEVNRDEVETMTSKGARFVKRRAVAAILALMVLTALALATHATQVEARPGRVTAAPISVNVG